MSMDLAKLCYRQLQFNPGKRYPPRFPFLHLQDILYPVVCPLQFCKEQRRRPKLFTDSGRSPWVIPDMGILLDIRCCVLPTRHFLHQARKHHGQKNRAHFQAPSGDITEFSEPLYRNLRRPLRQNPCPCRRKLDWDSFRLDHATEDRDWNDRLDCFHGCSRAGGNEEAANGERLWTCRPT